MYHTWVEKGTVRAQWWECSPSTNVHGLGTMPARSHKWVEFVIGSRLAPRVFLRFLATRIVEVDKLEFGDFGRKLINTRLGNFCGFRKHAGYWCHTIAHAYYIYFDITGHPCNLIGPQQCDLFTNRTIFATKTKQRLYKVNNRIAGKPALLFVLNRISFCSTHKIRYKSISSSSLKKRTTRSIKYWYKIDEVKWWLNSVKCNFGQKSYVISSRTLAARSFDFEITCIISDKLITLHKVQNCKTRSRIELIASGNKYRE